MKKTRFIALVLAVAVMLVGAGYAWWTETVKIDATVSTGNLDVDIVSFTATSDPEVHVTPSNTNYNTDDGNDEEPKLDVVISNLYPGANATATIKIKNNSSIPVMIKRETRIARCTNRELDNEGTLVDNFKFLLDFDSPEVTVMAEYEQNIKYWKTLSDLNIPAGKTVDLVLETWLDEDADRTYMDKESTYEIYPTFEQFNRY